MVLKNQAYKVHSCLTLTQTYIIILSIFDFISILDIMFHNINMFKLFRFSNIYMFWGDGLVGVGWNNIGWQQCFTNQINLGAHHVMHIQGPYNLCSNQQPYEMTEPNDCEQGQHNARPLQTPHKCLHC